ncbi:MAG: Trk system potassium transporter TrkA [Lachnospiraceae bacterium]|nr:Trk system potassium transporter TrkA [Lachnospiraceae bacterium]
MNIVIAGGGKVGEILIKKLSSEGHDLTLIDPNLQTLEKSIERYDIMSYNGNSASYDVLKQAGIKEADLLIAAAGSDEINLLTCFTAHNINPKIRTIARIRNPEYDTQSYIMRDDFALSMSFNPEKSTANEIRRLLKYPGFLKRDTFAKGRVEIVELKIDEKSPLCNLPLKDIISVTKCKVLICVVLREGKAIAPDGSFVLQADDKILVSAPAQNMSILLKSLGIVTHKARKVLIAGGSTVSYYLATALDKAGIAVRIIEKDMERCRELAGKLPNATIVHGDASSQNVLESEGISESDALITLTGMDELNLVISFFGNVCKVPKIITKLNHLNNNYVLDNLEIGSIVSPKEIATDNIVRYVRAMSNLSGAAVAVHSIAEGKAEAIEFRVDPETRHIGKPLKDIALRRGVLICCITHQMETEIPAGDSSFALGDTVIVVVSAGTMIMKLNDIFEA